MHTSATQPSSTLGRQLGTAKPSRRNLVKGAAWAAPAMVIATAAPAFADSLDDCAAFTANMQPFPTAPGGGGGRIWTGNGWLLWRDGNAPEGTDDDDFFSSGTYSAQADVDSAKQHVSSARRFITVKANFRYTFSFHIVRTHVTGAGPSLPMVTQVLASDVLLNDVTPNKAPGPAQYTTADLVTNPDTTNSLAEDRVVEFRPTTGGTYLLEFRNSLLSNTAGDYLGDDVVISSLVGTCVL